MSSFRISELQELENEFMPVGEEFVSGPDVDEPMTDQQIAEMERLYKKDAQLQSMRRAEDFESAGMDDDDVEEDLVKELDFS